MGGGVDFLQAPDRDVRVNLRRLQTGVTTLLLDVTDVRAMLEHERGAGVPEEMAGTGLAESGADDVARHHGRQVAHRQRRALLGHEERPGFVA